MFERNTGEYCRNESIGGVDTREKGGVGVSGGQGWGAS